MRISLLVSLFTILGLAAAPAAAQTHLYVPDSAANAVSVIDPATNAVTTTIAVGVAPSQVAIARAASRVYVTNTGSSTVSAIDTSIQDVVATIPVGDRPSGIRCAEWCWELRPWKRGWTPTTCCTLPARPSWRQWR